MINVCE